MKKLIVSLNKTEYKTLSDDEIKKISEDETLLEFESSLTPDEQEISEAQTEIKIITLLIELGVISQ